MCQSPIMTRGVLFSQLSLSVLCLSLSSIFKDLKPTRKFQTSYRSLDPKLINIVNIGPSFRGHYGSFSPNSPFPILPCELRTSPMREDGNEDSLVQKKMVLKDQKELDKCAQGLEVGNLSRLMGSEALNYTSGLENLYEKMLAKIESLARQVEKSSVKILEQENHNRKLRSRSAWSASLE